MKAVLSTTRFMSDYPALYRIGVQGTIPARWRDRLEGMSIVKHPSETEPPVTTLVGKLADQAALAGVLNTLFELHLPVVSVQRLSAESRLLEGETQ